MNGVRLMTQQLGLYSPSVNTGLEPIKFTGTALDIIFKWYVSTGSVDGAITEVKGKQMAVGIQTSMAPH